ncbi:MAG: c-type cytochrome [Thermoguttaceae bacterium]
MAFRIYFGIASLVVMGLCAINYWIELTPEWAGYQRNYYNLLAAKIEDPVKASRAAAAPARFMQIYNPRLGVVDRCVICHLGMENPLMDGAKNPFKIHPGNLLASHSPEAVGCTVCHQGQGLATTVADGHGNVPHWDKPLLTGHFVQAACTKCHHEDEVPQAPVLSRGKHLMHELGCVGCHRAGDGMDEEKVGLRLAVVGSKVSRPWLNKWLLNPRDYLPKGKMPQFHLRPQAANALAAYLATFHDTSIDASPEPKGDHDAGAAIFRRLQCITCHVTREDARGNPVGGTIGPDLRRVGNKVNKCWLAAFFRDPHAFYPTTKMPRFYLNDQETADLAAYASEEWVDYDLLDAEKKGPKIPPDSPALVEQGQNLFTELACSGCHELSGQKCNQASADLTFEGSKPVHDLDFGDAQVRHTIADFLYTKLKSPKSLVSRFRFPLGQDYAAALWKNLQPLALFSRSAALPEGSAEERLTWILAKVQEQGVLDDALLLPAGSRQEQAAWLGQVLSDAGALTPLKMPEFTLNDADAEALTIALMSQSAERVSLANYEVARKRKPIFDPKDDFGGLEQRYRCLSCHGIRGSGDPQACDLTLEGSKVNCRWLYGFLKNPYSMRRTITIAMPSFNFPDDQARFMSEYISAVFVDRQIGEGWKQGQERADEARGKALFDAKGCVACHQVNGKGGDVGPSFTTQVPEFPQGTWVGDKLRPEWVYQWLKDPQSLVPDALEPRLGLSDQEALDLTKHVMSLKNPDFLNKNPDVPKKNFDAPKQ